jgi:hypothetical protein
MRKLMIAAGFVAIATPAFAEQWWAFHKSTSQCSALPSTIAPTDIARRINGSIEDGGVFVNVTGVVDGKSRILSFFHTQTDCERAIPAIKKYSGE